ncbi:MAG: ABC transporter ATP-binding protein [Peptococcaceae bacterium]
MYQVTNISKVISGRKILGDLNIEIEPGELIIILGENGAGKSTLLKILALMHKPSSGQIKIGGIDALKTPQKVRPNLGVLSHKSFLYENLTVYENLEFYGQLYNVKKLKERIYELISKVGLELVLHEPVYILSRGMQQRLALARALIQDPDFLLLDEPQTGLDQDAVKILYSLLASIKMEGKGIVVVTHLFDGLFQISDKLLILKKGRQIYYGDIRLNLKEVKELYFSLAAGR